MTPFENWKVDVGDTLLQRKKHIAQSARDMVIGLSEIELDAWALRTVP